MSPTPLSQSLAQTPSRTPRRAPFDDDYLQSSPATASPSSAKKKLQYLSAAKAERRVLFDEGDEEDARSDVSSELGGGLPERAAAGKSSYDALPLMGRLLITFVGILLTFGILAKKVTVDDHHPATAPFPTTAAGRSSLLAPAQPSSSSSPSSDRTSGSSSSFVPPPPQQPSSSSSSSSESSSDWFLAEGNRCLANRLADAGQACASFVVNATDGVWHPSRTDDEVEEAFWRDYAPSFRSHNSKGIIRAGLSKAIAATFATRQAFPDLRVHVANVVCDGNDQDGYKSSATKVFLGTNGGDSPTYGRATNRAVSYASITNSLIVRDPATGDFRFKAEWDLRDELYLLEQLGKIQDDEDAGEQQGTAAPLRVQVEPPGRCQQAVAGWGSTDSIVAGWNDRRR